MFVYFSGLYCAIFFVLAGSTMIEDTFRECLISNAHASLGYCFGMGALNKLQSIDSEPEYDLLDGLSFQRDEQQPREAFSFAERDPGHLRTIIESVGQVFSSRSMKWDMDFIYPGLNMRVAPSNVAGGVLEFVMDPRSEIVAANSLKEVGTGRLIARQFLVPLLLGFKFSVTTLIPIIFGLIVLAVKKAIFLSKLGLIISSVVGLGTLLFSAQQRPPHYYGGHPQPGLGGHYGGHFGHGVGDFNRFSPGAAADFYDNPYLSDNSLPETNILKHVKEVQPTYSREERSGKRNFAWSDVEKSAS